MPNQYAVYTKVYAFQSWINQQLEVLSPNNVSDSTPIRNVESNTATLRVFVLIFVPVFALLL